jgi:hypothetical protein
MGDAGDVCTGPVEAGDKSQCVTAHGEDNRYGRGRCKGLVPTDIEFDMTAKRYKGRM